jgi:hypothetical protein
VGHEVDEGALAAARLAEKGEPGVAVELLEGGDRGFVPMLQGLLTGFLGVFIEGSRVVAGVVVRRAV